MHKKKILILAYSSLNLGDDLFIKILCDRYKDTNFYIISDSKYIKAFSDIENLTIISQIPYIDGLMNKLSIPFQLNGLKQINKAKNMDGIIQIGGSIFMQNSNWSARYKILNKLANLDIPFFVIGSNFGPYNQNEFLESYSSLFNKLDDICFRDSYSFNMFKEKQNIRVAPDVIFGLEPIINNKESNNVVISVIDLENRPDLKGYKTQYEELIVNIIKNLLKENMNVTLMSFCEREGDLKAISRIRENFNINEIQVYDYQGDISEALNIIASSSSIIATRFHSLILALVFKKKVFPFIYSKKTLNLLEDIKFDGKYTDIKELNRINPNDILEQLNFGKINNIDKFRDMADSQFKATDKFLK